MGLGEVMTMNHNYAATFKLGQRVKFEGCRYVYMVTTCDRTNCQLCANGAVPVLWVDIESQMFHISSENLGGEGMP